jgi:hypothetical protein
MADRLYYVYGVVPPATSLATAPAGVDGAPVAMVADGDLAALAGVVDASLYTDETEERLADLAWLAPRATAHDAVMTWASDAGPVVPLPLLSLFRSEQAVRAMLRDRRAELRELLDHVARGREFGVRVFRLDDELRMTLSSHSTAIAALEQEAAAARSPGQQYLLNRKLEAARKDELRRVGGDVAARTLEELAAASLAAVEDALPDPASGQSGVAVLNASFLVAHDAIDAFRGVVTRLVREYERRGFRFEFTGPWPPYHFARSAAGDR